MPALPTGSILMWSGSVATIPGGFVLCDGNNGTPDLRDRFVIGAGTTYNPGDAGGGNQHSHSFTTDGHSHSIPGGTGIEQGFNFLAGTSTDVDTGNTNAGTHTPPYYALAYIMKT